MVGRKEEGNGKPDSDAVRRALVFEQSIAKENSIVRGQSKFQINPLVKDRKGNSKNLSGVLAEKPNRRDLERFGDKKKNKGELPDDEDEAKAYERSQVELLRALPMDQKELPDTTSREVGWLLGVAMRLKQGLRLKSAPVSSAWEDEANATARSFAWSTVSGLGKADARANTQKPPWSSSASNRSAAYGAAPDGSEGSVSSRKTDIPYDFSRPNTSGGLERYWRPKSRSDVVAFADVFSQKTGTHPYLKPIIPKEG